MWPDIPQTLLLWIPDLDDARIQGNLKSFVIFKRMSRKLGLTPPCITCSVFQNFRRPSTDREEWDVGMKWLGVAVDAYQRRSFGGRLEICFILEQPLSAVSWS